MTNPAKHSAGSVTRKSKMRGPALLFTVVAVALASFSAVTWRATTTRITDLEDRIDRLTRTLDQRLPEGGWRAELERAGNEIGVRANESLRREGDRIRANIEARFEVRLQALTASLEAATRPGAERESGTRSAGSPPPGFPESTGPARPVSRGYRGTKGGTHVRTGARLPVRNPGPYPGTPRRAGKRP